MNSQITFHKRAALGVVLMALSASVSLADEKNINGSLSGNNTAVIQFPILYGAGGGTGTASNIGQFRYIIQVTVNLTTGAGTGKFVLVFSNGDTIYGTFAGQGSPTNNPSLGHIVEYLTIGGGTGRFQRATGTLTVDRLVDVTTVPNYDSTSGTVAGTINVPN